MECFENFGGANAHPPGCAPGKRWRTEKIDELDEQKCTQKIRILPELSKKWPIDELNDDELDKFYCISDHTTSFNL